MRREIIPGEEATNEVAYSPQEIEQIVYDTYPSRDSYLDKISKIALHLSLFTRTGRVSYTFQNHIFDKNLKINQQTDTDFLHRLLSEATDEEVFPELYLSFDYITEHDRQVFQENMAIEHAAIMAGLQEVVRKCCDSKVCTVNEMSDAYDEELFKEGSVFRTAARSVCMSRKIKSWIPPSTQIHIPDTSPIENYSKSEEIPVGPITFDNMLYGELINSRSTGATTMGLAVTPSIGDIRLDRSVYVSEPAEPRINRNFGVSAELRCFNSDNLIHNLATLPPGKLLELPFGSELLDDDVQKQLFEQFKTEIGMRRYYLSTLEDDRSM